MPKAKLSKRPKSKASKPKAVSKRKAKKPAPKKKGQLYIGVCLIHQGNVKPRQLPFRFKTQKKKGKKRRG